MSDRHGAVTMHGNPLTLTGNELSTGDKAPDVELPVYDERGMASIQRVGLGMYMDDALTTANIGRIFAE